MKSLLISEVFPPQTGGSGRWFWEVYRRLPRDRAVVAAGEYAGDAAFDEGHDLDVVRRPLNMREWGLRSLSGLAGYSRLSRDLRRLARDRGIEQVHAGRVLPEGWLAWILKTWCGLPYLVYVHGEEMQHASTSREHSWMVRRVIEAADLLIANSRNTADILRRGWRVPDEKIRVLHPGVDTRRYVPGRRDEAARHELGWGERPVVLTVGRLQKRKGHDMMIRALATVRRAASDVLYAIAGDGEARPVLERLAEQQGLAGHVQFLGEISDERLVLCYQQCDLFVLANRQVGEDIEGFGIVLLEAQACGKPVIAGASGGTAETMRIPETGLTLDCTGPEPLARTVADLLLDPRRRAVMGAAGRDWVVKRFDWESLSRQAALFTGSGSPSPESLDLEAVS
ncbi:MAG: glycosyltransferase family 4 protein [Planctomycetaceae bacterium]